jgi:hypothetical protein
MLLEARIRVSLALYSISKTSRQSSCTTRVVIWYAWGGIYLIPLPHRFNMVILYKSDIFDPRYYIFYEIYHKGGKHINPII